MLRQTRPDTGSRKVVSHGTAEATGRKGKNSSKACSGCRRRKSKCDGGNPCSTCELYCDTCTYTQEQDGRRPAAKAYVSALEERVRHLEGLLNARQDPSGGAGEPHGAESHRTDGDEATQPFGPVDWRRHLPPELAEWDEELHEDLLARFFAYFNTWCLWVDEDSFRRDLALCLSSNPLAPSRTSFYSPLLHNAIIALACALSNDTRVSDRSAARACAARAKALLEDEGERPQLSTQQGLLLVGSYHSGNSLQGLGYLYSGIGFRMSQTLGLGIDCSPLLERGVITAAMKQQRTRVMWTAYVQDNYVGRNPSILRSTLELALPEIDPELDQHPWLGPANATEKKALPSFASSTFHWLCRLAIIEEHVLTAVYALRVNLYSAQTLNRISEIALDLETWASSLPISLRIAPQTIKPPPPHIILLNALYQFVVILLYRPYYIRHNAEMNSPLNDTAVKRCSSAATRIVALFELYQRSPGLRYAPISATQMAFGAATTHLLALVNAESAQQRKKAAELRDSTHACSRILREMGKGYTCALQTADIFDGLVEKWANPSPPADGDSPVSSAEPGETASAAAPVQLAAAQALDPHSDLARELLRLGWKPPTAASLPTALMPVPPSAQARVLNSALR
ncbi:hypothetical protein Rhopal_006300-T1 [Rhodotorula paludigena]|uniref:Zn(2)-C6 fungal-type domain-containing protein n=1 Tax=Rhodotorula paludigena TaxID=86838 RepID=A0AAV5GSN5_9BASI|nr:hypothetical protein Rhopal_006300-T1 [Rhodotorula paludigena]